MRYSAFFFCTKSSKIQFWTAQFGLATLQMLDCCMWLLATVLNSTVLAFMILALGKSYMHSFSPWSQLSRSLFFCLVSMSVLGCLHCSHSPKSNVSLCYMLPLSGCIIIIHSTLGAIRDQRLIYCS